MKNTMNVYRIDFTTVAGNPAWETHNGVTMSRAIDSFIAHKRLTRFNAPFALDESLPVIATYCHRLVPVEF